jgi:hypothetical protein
MSWFRHKHRWKTVIDMSFLDGGYEVEQFCKCGWRRKVTTFPPSKEQGV